MSVGPPKDNWNLTYCILFLHGIGVLLPWNMLTTIAQDYYVDLKLSDHDASGNITTQSTYALNFFSYLGIFAQAPNFILNVVNLVLRIKGDLLNRVMAMIIVLFVSVVFTMIWIWIDTDAWKTLFFWMTMVSFIIFNGAGGVYQNSMFGVAAVLPSKFTNAIIFGNNVCGTFIAIINIITIAALSDKPKIAATVYFAVSLAIVLVCFLSVPVLKKLPFYQYYENLSKFPQKDEEDQEEVVLNMATYWSVFKKCWLQCLNVWCVFFVTLSVYPTVLNDIETPAGSDFFISKKYFSAVTCFVIFNLFASFGCVLAIYVPFKYPRLMTVPIFLRLLFIPFFLFCNFRPDRRTWNVWFLNEWWYIIGHIVLAVTSGYFSSLTMMFAPRTVENSRSHIAGMVSAVFLIGGICSGVGFTFFITPFVENWGPLHAGSESH